MEKENKSKKFWDYALLIVGGILILIPLLYTFLSSFKTTKQIMNHFFAWPNPWTTANFQRLFSDQNGLLLELNCHYGFINCLSNDFRPNGCLLSC